MKPRSFFVLSAIFLYAAVVSCTPVLDHLVLFPWTGRIPSGNATRRTVPFEGGELEVWTAESPAARAGRPKTYVLRFYGNADRADRWVADEAEMFGDRALEFWGMNYPGFGGSTGPARLARIGPGALAAFDELRREAGERPIVLFGASLGTTAALHVAAKRPVAGLVLQNPPALRQMILRQFGWWNLWLLAGPLSLKVPAELDSINNAKASHARAIFLLAEKDEVVAPRFQQLVANSYAGEKRVISLRGANHNSPIDPEGWRTFQEALNWLMPGISSDDLPRAR
jgi:pimeloyl-ACP methyl ester carboxylesterase